MDDTVDHVERVRRLCLGRPGTSEKLSHGEPTFFVGKKVFAMFANNHHGDGHIAVWLPVPSGMQSSLIQSDPEVFFKPPYVGHRGWVGIELARISDADLDFHIQVAWELAAPKRLVAGLHQQISGSDEMANKSMAETTDDFPRLAAPARRALANAGYTRLEQLAQVSEAEVMRLHGMGPKALEQLRLALKTQGRSFAEAKC